MQVATLDILTEKGGFAPEVARAIGEAIELESSRSQDAWATRQDLSEMHLALSQELTELRGEFKRDVAGLEVKLEAHKAELVRWVFLAILGQGTLLTGLMYFFLQFVR